MKQFLELVQMIQSKGIYKEDRTGTGTYSIFGHQMRFDLSEGFPLVTAKQTHLKSVIHELLWFLKGDTNIRYLKENGVRIWDEWVKEGTQEYRPMTEDELKAAIKKASLNFIKISETKPTYNFTLLPEDSDVFCELLVSKDEKSVEVKYRNKEGLEDIYRSLYNNEDPKVLAAGELGPVYGSQWRSWPYEKVVSVDDAEAMVSAGYEDIGLISDNIDGSGYCQKAVVRRTIDQITNLIDMLKKNPDSRRLIVSAWNPALVDEMALPPCHTLFQFYSCELREYERMKLLNEKIYKGFQPFEDNEGETYSEYLDRVGIPRRKLSCQLYQR